MRSERIAKWTGAAAIATSGAPSRQYVYDDEGRLIGEYSGSGELISEHVWLDDTPVAVLKPASSPQGGQAIAASGSAPALRAYFVHPDHLDTPRVIVNAANQTVWRWDSAPYGDTAADENPNALGEFSYSLRLPGQQFDGESGQHYNYFRDYEAATGRYVQSDPIGLEDGPNTFGYSGSNPLIYFDSFGLARRCSGVKRFLGLCSPNPKPKVPPWNSPRPSGGMGIYMLVDCNGEIVYIGQTNNFRRRWGEHRTKDDGQIRTQATSCCPVVMVPLLKLPVFNKGLFDKLEGEAIRKYRPRGNTNGKPKDCCT